MKNEKQGMKIEFDDFPWEKTTYGLPKRMQYVLRHVLVRRTEVEDTTIFNLTYLENKS